MIYNFYSDENYIYCDLPNGQTAQAGKNEITIRTYGNQWVRVENMIGWEYGLEVDIFNIQLNGAVTNFTIFEDWKNLNTQIISTVLDKLDEIIDLLQNPQIQQTVNIPAISNGSQEDIEVLFSLDLNKTYAINVNHTYPNDVDVLTNLNGQTVELTIINQSGVLIPANTITIELKEV